VSASNIFLVCPPPLRDFFVGSRTGESPPLCVGGAPR